MPNKCWENVFTTIYLWQYEYKQRTIEDQDIYFKGNLILCSLAWQETFHTGS